MSPPRRRRSTDDEPLLFDLPLASPEEEERRIGRGARAPVQSDLFAVPLEEDDDDGDVGESPNLLLDLEPESTSTPLGGPVVAGVGARLLAGGADLLLHLGVVAAVYLGLVALGVEPRVGHWPAVAVFLATFSFLSSVVSLAFWGQTAGMAWRGLQTRDRLQRPLTFRQAALRWAGGLLTFATAGLPLLAALRGSSLSDWMSRSVTYSAGSGRAE